MHKFVLHYASLNASNMVISRLADSVSASDAATKGYVDSNYIKKDGTAAITANLDLGSKNLVSLVDPTAAQQAATKNYLDTSTTNSN
jgi:hypothetical protein